MRNAIVLLLFFLSGAAALVYQVTWARSLGLVFGVSHQAVATVLAVFMGGQALGGALIGRRADLVRRPLRLYGLLEIGIGAAAVAFLGLMEAYPLLYVPAARALEGNPLLVTLLRTAFAVAAMIVPTTLMGGTLPVMTRFMVRPGERVGRQLSFLYAFNTFGAVAGTLAAGFLLLRALGVTATLLAAAGTSVAVGFAAILLDRRAGARDPAPRAGVEPDAAPAAAQGAAAEEAAIGLARRLTLLGIGVSGFCALGYEVLWTRMLSLVLGTSVYSFAVMLVAFLAGIGAGSHAFALLRRARWAERGGRGAALAFAGTQVAIGATALAVTVLMRDVPEIAGALRSLLSGDGGDFRGRLLASAAIAFAFMFVPAFFMGLAFPAAGTAWAEGRADAGRSVGRLLAVNTVGAILGSIASGFVLLRFFGIERSLQMLVVLNLAAGLAVVASAVAGRGARRWPGAVAAAAALVIFARGAYPDWGRAWDQKFFATYQNNVRSDDTPEERRQKLQYVDVLYYHEGVNETVSVIRPRGSVQTYIVNGRTEASTAPTDVQLQKTLGHLPMLLHPRPRSAFVLGTGSGMTLGAISVHPGLERLVLGEIEEGMLGVARTYDRWNHRVLDDPRLEIVINDGRNFLATTRERFDVISADPTHPWSGGAGYLYTREYFRSVADRLAPGGIACQWLPLYELTVRDVKTVLRTFADAFEHVLVFVTATDAALIGSSSPIVVDEAEMARRMEVPAIQEDLAPLHMGTAPELLSLFLMGTEGARAFGRDGDVNTDDNLVLEFSAPASQGKRLDAENLRALARHRESLLPYLRRPASQAEAELQRERWTRHLETSRIFDEAHARFLAIDPSSPEVDGLLALVEAADPGYGPLRFLRDEQEFWNRQKPALVDEVAFEVRDARGAPAMVRLAALRRFVGHERVIVSFLDPGRRKVYGHRFVDGQYERLESKVASHVAATLAAVRAAAAYAVPLPGAGVPAEVELDRVLEDVIAQGVTLRAPGPGSPGLPGASGVR